MIKAGGLPPFRSTHGRSQSTGSSHTSGSGMPHSPFPISSRKHSTLHRVHPAECNVRKRTGKDAGAWGAALALRDRQA